MHGFVRIIDESKWTFVFVVIIAILQRRHAHHLNTADVPIMITHTVIGLCRSCSKM